MGYRVEVERLALERNPDRGENDFLGKNNDRSQISCLKMNQIFKQSLLKLRVMFFSMITHRFSLRNRSDLISPRL